MKNTLAFIWCGVLLTQFCFAQSDVKTENALDAYTQTINARAQKIVAALGVTDSVKGYMVQAIITDQYRNLNTVHADRDEKIKEFKAKNESKEITDAAIKNIQDDAAQRINQLHKSFLTNLSRQLTNEQVVQVKDGMTYNVVNITYNNYLDMLPNLTEEQKKQIRLWLEEAREYAMDAETSEKKHAWFGKYKGKINNYLSAAGYDLKKESAAWQQRIKERKAAGKEAGQ